MRLRWNSRYFEDTVIFLVVLAALWRIRAWVHRLESVQRCLPARIGCDLAAVLIAGWVAIGFTTHYVRIDRHLTPSLSYLLNGSSLLIGILLAGTALVIELWRHVPATNVERRRFLRVVRAATIAGPAAVTAFGIAQRRDFELNHVRVPIPGLPKDLQGLRIVQLSDIHLSPYLDASDLRYVVDMANDARGHVAVITGDLITRRGDPLDACLAELARVKADAGVLGCHGNHEIYAATEAYTTEQGARIGIDFLRRRNRELRFGSATLNIAGVDYQRTGAPYLAGAERLIVRRPESLNVLLSHNPDVFRVAPAQGWDLTLAGHTHGGQVTVEILNQYLNIARFYTPYVSGLYRQGRSSIYVNRGIGTIGLPARIGVRPEVAVVELCAI